MGSAKELVVKVIPAAAANELVKRVHYSGKVVNNSTLHFGVFYKGFLHGVMQFGNPMDRRKLLPLVEGTLWNEFIELNRMAFDEDLPRNSESRAIAIAVRLIRKNAPHIKWIVSFADGTQCGDGTIYRASGFLLTKINPNRQIMKLPDGSVVTKKTLDSPNNMVGSRYGTAVAKEAGAYFLPGFQLRYIYLIHKGLKLNVDPIAFDEIDRLGAGMYKGEKIARAERREKSAEVESNACFLGNEGDSPRSPR